MSGDDSSSNPFVRFKNTVDAKVRQMVASWQPGNNSDFQAKADSASASRNSESSFVTNGGTVSMDVNVSRSVEQYHPATQSSRSDPLDPDIINIAVNLQLRRFRSWLNDSPYSPRLLDRLPQPVPRDAPPGSTEHFTFSDAFRDLLAVSSGQPLRSFQELCDDSRAHKVTPVLTEGRLLPYFESLMGRRRFWDTYFHIASFKADAIRILDEVSSAAAKLGVDVDTPEMRKHRHSLIEEVAKCDEERELIAITNQIQARYRAGLMPVYDERTKRVQERYSPWSRPSWAQQWRIAETKQQLRQLGETLEQRMEKDSTEEDMYQQNQTARSTLTVVPPLVWEAPTRQKDQAPVSADDKDDSTEESTQYSRSGDRTVTRNEKKVSDGVTHITQTITRYDSEGNVKSRSVVTKAHTGEEDDGTQTQSKSYAYSYAWGGRSSARGSEGSDGNAEKEADAAGRESSQKRTWFWSSWR